MKPQVMNITDPNTIVTIIIHLKGGGMVFIYSSVKFAREALVQWKKFLLYYTTSEEKRKEMEPPFTIYHFLEGLPGAEANPAMCSVYFPDVSAMQYVEIPEEDDSNLKATKAYTTAIQRFASVMEKGIKAENRGESWRNPSEDSEKKEPPAEEQQ